MSRIVLWALAAAFALTAVALIGLVGVEEGTVAEWLFGVAMTPGFALPEAYWGAVHDPLQFLIAAALNVAFYTGVFGGIGLAIWKFTQGRLE
jgi:hypothetical protein